MNLGQVDRTVNRIIIDYAVMTDRFGYLRFGDFVEVWRAADDMMRLALDVGFTPGEVSDLLMEIEP